MASCGDLPQFCATNELIVFPWHGIVILVQVYCDIGVALCLCLCVLVFVQGSQEAIYPESEKIHETVTKLDNENAEHPLGVIEVVSGYVFRKARDGNRGAKQSQKVSLDARSCRLLGLVVQATHKMDPNFKIFEEYKMLFRVPVKNGKIAATRRAE